MDPLQRGQGGLSFSEPPQQHRTGQRRVQFPSRYHQVVQNLCTNTRDGLPCLTTGAAHLPGDQILCLVIGGGGGGIMAGSGTEKEGGPLESERCTLGACLPMIRRKKDGTASQKH